MTVTVDISEQIIYNVGRELRSPIDLNNNRYVLDRIEQKYDVKINPCFSRINDGVILFLNMQLNLNPKKRLHSFY